ncbi:unnamed protein product [Ilex paraguariensis]|uniref:G3BP-like protein n=1 Tax=Ilex paraguariensis TaxID=185542 RepID=A0ABC8R3J8_9AQUA
MATPFHLPVTAAQVGTYFVGQYYQILQTQPDFVHQFYSDASTMLRTDGNTRETASAMLQIHTLIMSLNYTGIEIKTAHSLESWNGGVLVMVSGSVLIKDYNGRRKFVQTFFLAPQEKGYFVLNDIFHFIEDEPIHQLPAAYFTQSNLDSKENASTVIQEPVSSYLLGGDHQAREFVAPANTEENGPIDDYSLSDERLQQVPETENVLEDNFTVRANGSLQNTMNPLKDHLSPVEEPIGQPQKHTYASIVTKGQSAPPQPSFNKTIPPVSEWHHVPEPSTQDPVASSITFERSGAEAAEDVSALDDEVEIKSVYVRNVPSMMSASEIEEEFRQFGRLKPDGVAIRTRKDIDVCYAFVEFEDITGVQNAVKASTVQIAGHQLYIEGRRANRSYSSRGGRGRGRGRGSYQMDASRGRYGARSFGRGSGPDEGDRDYNRQRGNGFYRQGSRQDRVFSGNHQMSRNGQYPSD